MQQRPQSAIVLFDNVRSQAAQKQGKLAFAGRVRSIGAGARLRFAARGVCFSHFD
jgi:hypothetical protein